MPFDKAGADLFGFISQRDERRSLVMTTNLPFARWSEVFLDATAAAAVIDRIVHHATVLTTAGDSYQDRHPQPGFRAPQEVTHSQSGNPKMGMIALAAAKTRVVASSWSSMPVTCFSPKNT